MILKATGLVIGPQHTYRGVHAYLPTEVFFRSPFGGDAHGGFQH